jgi:hypothetical protein
LTTNLSKRRRITYSADELFPFLRTRFVNEIKLESIAQAEAQEPGSPPVYDTSGSYKAAYHNFQGKRDQIKLIPFDKPLALKKYLSSAPYPITNRHHRLLLEDIMLLKKGDHVVCLMSMNNPLLVDVSSTQKWQQNFRESWAIDALQPVLMQRTMYYAVHLEVSANPNVNSLNSGVMTENEVSSLCSRNTGGGVYFRFPNGVKHLFEFVDMLETPNATQFWCVSRRSR